MEKSTTREKFNILELYSGIGGFHFAIKRLFDSNNVPYRLTAVDINTTANQVYRLNHCCNDNIQLLERNIQSFTVKDLDEMNLSLLTMSPPCQPFSRLGKQRDLQDFRCDSFRHIMELLPRLENIPRFFMLENVKGFETSNAHKLLIETLNRCKYKWKEFLLSPEQFRIPNSRQRYYLIARHSPEFDPKDTKDREIHCKVPIESELSIFDSPYVKYSENLYPDVGAQEIQNYLEDLDQDELEKLQLNDEKLFRYRMIIDLVTPQDTSTNCFTKAYGHRLEGCGSILVTRSSIDDIYGQIARIPEAEIPERKDEIIKLLRKLGLRFFSPREIANLMCFPPELTFPSDLNIKQQYRVLGNSVNVFVIFYLLKIMLPPQTKL